MQATAALRVCDIRLEPIITETYGSALNCNPCALVVGELLLSIYNWSSMEVGTYMEPSDGRCRWIGFDADVFQMDGKRASPLLLTTSPEYSGDITVRENKQEWYVK